MAKNNNKGKKVGHTDPQPDHGNDTGKHKHNKGGSDTRPGNSHALMVRVY